MHSVEVTILNGQKRVNYVTVNYVTKTVKIYKWLPFR